MSGSHEFYLPEELFINNILPRLPIKTLLRFKAINKRFHSIISSPYFARLHLKKSTSSGKNQHLLINHKSCFLSFDLEANVDAKNCNCFPFNDDGDILSDEPGLARIINTKCFHVRQSHLFMIGSCFGLVCLKTKFNFFYIWNPATLECRKIPFLRNQKKHDAVWGFVNVASGNDSKVIRICQNNNNNGKIIQVFSLSENNWSFSQEELQGYGEYARLAGAGVSVNDVTYWSYRYFDPENRTFRWWVIGFDWVVWRFKSIPRPEWHIGGFFRVPLMYVMEGCLCACWEANDSQIVEVGMFKEEDGKSSWKKLNQLGQNIVLHPMNIFIGFRHLPLMPNITTQSRFAIRARWTRDTLLFIDPAEEPPEDAHELKIPSSRNVISYSESLISPFENLEQTQE